VTYAVFISASALKALAHLPEDVKRRIRAAISALAENPRPDGSTKLRGRFKEGWRIRVGSFRALYTIDDQARTVTVFRIGPRDVVYQ